MYPVHGRTLYLSCFLLRDCNRTRQADGGGAGDEGDDDVGFLKREAVRLPENCPACGCPGESLTCMVDIPHFKEVMIMAFDCEECGFKSSEVGCSGDESEL